MSKAPGTITYASVVSRETAGIALLMAVFNDLDVKVGDILNAYITAPRTKKVWTVCGPEFSINSGKRAIIVRALYGLKMLVLRSAHTWFHSCYRWVTHLAKPTLTYGIWLRSDLLATLDIVPTYYIMLTTFYASTTTL
jgi:hypothetical protein